MHPYALYAIYAYAAQSAVEDIYRAGKFVNKKLNERKAKKAQTNQQQLPGIEPGVAHA